MESSENRRLGEFTEEHYRKIVDGLKLYNEGHYWECHEYLEDLWAEDTTDYARYVYWAVLQVGVCLYHLEDSNMIGAKGLVFKAREKFSFINKNNVLQGKLRDLLDWDQLESIVDRIPHGSVDQKDYDRLHQFKFRILDEK